MHEKSGCEAAVEETIKNRWCRNEERKYFFDSGIFYDA
jgi:hypothetical protein